MTVQELIDELQTQLQDGLIQPDHHVMVMGREANSASIYTVFEAHPHGANTVMLEASF